MPYLFFVMTDIQFVKILYQEAWSIRLNEHKTYQIDVFYKKSMKIRNF